MLPPIGLVRSDRPDRRVSQRCPEIKPESLFVATQDCANAVIVPFMPVWPAESRNEQVDAAARVEAGGLCVDTSYCQPMIILTNARVSKEAAPWLYEDTC